VNTQTKRLLLIEDNPGDVDLVRLRLMQSSSEREASYEISCADRLSTGLAALSRERPAVVLLDLYLPDSRGAETFDNLLRQAPGVPIVVLTGRDDDELLVNAVQHGVQDYLVKGAFDCKRLAHTLTCAIERQALATALGLSVKEQSHFKERLSREMRNGLTSINRSITTMLDDLATPVTEEQRQLLNASLVRLNRLRTMMDDQSGARLTESRKRCTGSLDVAATSIGSA
jgi:DNA-binding NarL/FixJ family response regulator